MLLQAKKSENTAMTSLKRQLQESRQLRDDARNLIDADISQLREMVTGDELKERANAIKDQASENFSDKASVARDKASAARDKATGTVADNRGAVIGAAAAIAGGLALWLARKPIGAFIAEQLADEASEPLDPDDLQEQGDLT